MIIHLYIKNIRVVIQINANSEPRIEREESFLKIYKKGGEEKQKKKKRYPFSPRYVIMLLQASCIVNV